MIDKSKATFANFLELFEGLEFPFMIHTDLHEDFSSAFRAMPSIFLDRYMVQEAGIEIDDMTEIVPLFRLYPNDDVVGIIVWKASLLVYEYILMTFEKNGSIVDQQVIAGQKSDGHTLLTRVANIENDMTFVVMEGEGSLKRVDELGESREIYFEITPAGLIQSL